MGWLASELKGHMDFFGFWVVGLNYLCSFKNKRNFLELFLIALQ